LDTLKDNFNNHRVRKDKNKKLPSGTSPNISMALYPSHGGENCLQAVDVNVVRALAEEIGGEDLIRFVSAEYAAHAEGVLAQLGVVMVTLENVWNVFTTMLPHMPT
jgi:hypothetical protein